MKIKAFSAREKETIRHMMVTNVLYSRDALRAFMQNKPHVEYQIRLNEAWEEDLDKPEVEVAEEFLRDHTDQIESVLKFKKAHWKDNEPISTETEASAKFFHEILEEMSELAEDAWASERLASLKGEDE